MLASASAQARPADVHLIWQRPVASQCPTRGVLQADVEALMGRPVFTSQAERARVTVRGVIEEGADGVRVRLQAVGERGQTLGTRELTATDGGCAQLRDAIALVLTLFVEYQPDSASELPTSVGLGARIAFAQAPMPRFATAVGPTVFLQIGSALQLFASAAYWPPVSIQTQRGVGAKLQALSLELRACARLWAGLGLCAGAENGALLVSPLRLRGPAQQTRLLSHGVLAGSWELALEDTGRLELAVAALLSFSRPQLSYLRTDGQQMQVHRPALLGAILQFTVIIPAS